MTKHRDVIAPIVHMNGSGKSQLIDQYMKVYHELNKALDDACKATPHPRDYYVSNKEGQWNAAHEEYAQEVLRKLKDAKDYVFNLAIAIHGQA
jgi:hypothetical protein